MKNELLIVFPASTGARKAQLANSLRDTLEQLIEIEKVSVLRERPDAQDTGSIVSVILESSAIVALVGALASWLVRNNQARITIKQPNNHVIIENLKSTDVPKAIAALKGVMRDE